jgi:Tetratricopeptide repeat
MSFGYSRRFTLPSSSSRTIDEAARFSHSRDYANAERCCRELLQHEPRQFDALHLIGVVCLDDGRPGDAVPYLQQAASEQPDNARAHYHLGAALLGMKQYEPAEAALRCALALQPSDCNTLVNLHCACGLRATCRGEPLLPTSAGGRCASPACAVQSRPIACRCGQVGRSGRRISYFAVPDIEMQALISVLDLVVTIDTSVAHLDSALAAPVWIMLQPKCRLALVPRARRQSLVSDRTAFSAAAGWSMD